MGLKCHGPMFVFWNGVNWSRMAYPRFNVSYESTVGDHEMSEDYLKELSWRDDCNENVLRTE
jgi:hypothetical protein